MTPRRPVTPAPDLLETYCQQFDALFSKCNQREGFRRYLEGLLLPQSPMAPAGATPAHEKSLALVYAR